MTFVMVYALTDEIALILSFISDIWTIVVNFLDQKWSILIFLLLGLVFKLIFYFLYFFFILVVWFFLVIKLNWINFLILLPMKRALIYAVTKFSLVERYKDSAINYGRNQLDRAHDGFIKWPLPLRLFSFPAVLLFSIASFLFFIFWNALRLLIANKLSDKVVEIVFRKIIMIYPKSRAIVQPVLDYIESGVDNLDHYVKLKGADKNVIRIAKQ